MELNPKSTRIPNILLDLIFPFLRESERAVVLYICRRTYGFQRESATIALRQFTDGLQHSEGYPLDFGCGVGHAKVIEALKMLASMGLVEVEKHGGNAGRGHTNEYRLNLHSEIGQKVTLWQHLENAREIIGQKVTLYRNRSESDLFKRRNRSESDLEIGQKVTTQKKEKQRTKKLSLSPQKMERSEEASDDREPSKFSHHPMATTLTVPILIDGWNNICGGHGRLPCKIQPTESLREKIRRRLREHPEEDFWNQVLNKIVDSDFLSGKRGGWRATLDWLVTNADNCVKVYEGGYDNVGTQTQPRIN